MPIKNTPDRYGIVARYLHWLIVIGITIMLIIGFFHDYIGDKALRSTFMRFHMSLGILILVLMVLRLLWALTSHKPQPLPNIPRWQQIASKAAHGLLYAVLILMPISGWVMVNAHGGSPVFFGLFKLPAIVPANKAFASFMSDVHSFLAWTIIVLVAIHLIAIIKHLVVDKHNLFKRMI